jgi:general secretion pathway protein G
MERRSHANGTSGFTLIEVLLVVAILGILAAVVVVNVGGRREQAMISSTRASIANIAAAVDLYEVDTGRYPSGLQSLVSNDGAPNWNGPYIRGGMPSDAWGTQFQFSPSGESGYTITSAGPDLTFGGGDDLTN